MKHIFIGEATRGVTVAIAAFLPIVKPLLDEEWGSLPLFHAIELRLKEQLYRANPVLIYKNIDKKVTDDSYTVGFGDAIIRLENTGIKLPDDQRTIVEKIQGRRNRIEHHRYDQWEAEDAIIIAEALKLIFYFAEFVLHARLEEHIDHGLIVSMRAVMDYNELEGLAEFRFKDWAKKRWPKWDNMVEDIPEEFEGTHDCPECGDVPSSVENGEAVAAMDGLRGLGFLFPRASDESRAPMRVSSGVSGSSPLPGCGRSIRTQLWGCPALSMRKRDRDFRSRLGRMSPSCRRATRTIGTA